MNAACAGVLEIVSNYLKDTNRHVKGHSIRVAFFTEDMGVVMDLPRREIKILKAAALLHEIGKTKFGMDLLNKAAFQPGIKKQLLSSHSEKDAKILSLAGSLLSEALPILSAFNFYYSKNNRASSNVGKRIPMGAAIIAVADAYDRIRTDRPHRAEKPCWKAFEEIAKDSGTQYHQDVIKAFKLVLTMDDRKSLARTHVE